MQSTIQSLIQPTNTHIDASNQAPFPYRPSNRPTHTSMHAITQTPIQTSNRSTTMIANRSIPSQAKLYEHNLGGKSHDMHALHADLARTQRCMQSQIDQLSSKQMIMHAIDHPITHPTDHYTHRCMQSSTLSISTIQSTNTHIDTCTQDIMFDHL